MKSTWMRWGVCTLCVLAMIAVLGGCAKKTGEQTETTAETTEDMQHSEMAETTAPAMSGTYSAAMANGTASLMLNTDMTASFSMQATENTPAQVENGTWAAGGMENTVDVTFSKEVEGQPMSMTLNFAASGDSLMLTNGDTVGLGGLVLMKQQ